MFKIGDTVKVFLGPKHSVCTPTKVGRIVGVEFYSISEDRIEYTESHQEFEAFKALCTVEGNKVFNGWRYKVDSQGKSLGYIFKHDLEAMAS